MSNRKTEKQKLNRESDLYQSAIRSKLIKETENKSEISEITDIYPRYKLAWVATKDTKGRRQEKVENISAEEIQKIQNMDEKQKIRKLTNKHPNHWNIAIETRPNPHIEFIVKHPDGKEKKYINSIEIKYSRHLKKARSLIEYANNSKTVTYNPGPDEETLEIDKSTYQIEPAHIKSLTKQDDHQFLKSYLKKDKVWVQTKIGRPRHDNNKIYYPIQIEDTKIEVEIDNPNESDEIWDFVDLFDVEDPIELHGSGVYICPRNIAWGSSVTTDKWAIRNELSLSVRTVRKIRQIFN